MQYNSADMDVATIAIVVVIVFVATIIIQQIHQAKRRQALLEKYGDEEIVSRIMQKKIWQGMTEDMLRDSWGKPDSIDTKVYKTKTKEILKYGQVGKNRYANRVTVENGKITGWEQKRG